MVTLREQIESQGYGKSGDIGGQPKQRYWTPDGREIFSMPDMHEFTRRKNGKILETGLRDANFDKGWLSQRPLNLKLHCPHCDYWHDTSEEIDQCGIKKETFIVKHKEEAEKELGKNGRVGKLETEMSEIKSMLKQLLEVRNGTIL